MTEENRDKWLYLIAGERNIRDGSVEYANVGDAYDVDERLKSIDYARKAAGGNWVVLGKWNIGPHRDHEVHRLLKKRNIVFDPEQTGNTEEVRFDLPVEEAKALVGACVNELLTGVARKASFSMRPEQAECCEKASAYFEAGGDRFLMDAKMRFGKTHTTYQIARRIGAKRILVLTYKPAVEDSWREDVEGHVDFEGWRFHRVEDGDAGPGVYFSSMQGILSDDRSEADRRKWIYGSDWDLVAFDEEHYGSRSDKSMAVREALEPRAARWLFLSGTPFQARLSGEFSDDQTYTWSYSDEQRAKRAWDGPGNPYAVLPDMSFHTYSFTDRLKASNAKLYADDEQFRMNKLFAATEEGFENPGDVGDFLDLVGGTSLEAKRAEVSPWHSRKIDRPMLNHTLWILPPSVLSARWLKEALEAHPFFGDFRILNVAGSEDVTKLETLRGEIARSEKTITLSIGRFTTGVTVPEWGAVFFLDDGRSPMAYYQAAFRSQSPWKMRVDAGGNVLQLKERCYVVDFNPHRLLEMVYVMQAAARDRGAEDISKAIQTYLECAPIYRYGEVQPVEVDAEAVLQAAINPRNFVEKFSSGFSIDLTKATSATLAALAGIDPQKADVFRKAVTDAGISKGKIKEGLKGLSKAEKKDVEKTLKALRERAQSVLLRFPSYLFVTPLEETCCQDIVKRGETDVFQDETGVTVEQFDLMLRSGFLDEQHLDNCIIGFNQIEKTIPKMTEAR